MRRFHTGLMPFSYPKPKGFPFRGKGFMYRLVKSDPHGHHKKLTHYVAGKFIPDHPKEIVIDALTEEAARRGHDLLWSSFAVVSGGEWFTELHDIDKNMVEDKELKESLRKNKKPFPRGTLNTTGIPHAAELAAKASFRRSAVYAISKYHFSVSLCNAHLVDLDPHFATETFPKLKRPIHQVHATTSIALAYGAIEELGLEVRASSKNPSTLPGGTWNPVVREDLEQRLVKAGIDITDPINWQIRGNKTKLEADKPKHIHHTSIPSPWARWTVRDRMVDIVDAIAHLSWLRSHVSSHRLKPSKAGLLSMYDITNGQYLARQLILESMGLWKKWIREDAER